MRLLPPHTPAGFFHLSYRWAARIPGWIKPLRFQLGKNQHPSLGQPPATSPLLPSPRITSSKSPAINIHLLQCLPPQAPSPPALRLPVLGSGNASLQSVYHLSPPCTPSANGLPKLVCGAALASPQDCCCKLMARQFLLKTLMNVK